METAYLLYLIFAYVKATRKKTFLWQSIRKTYIRNYTHVSLLNINILHLITSLPMNYLNSIQ